MDWLGKWIWDGGDDHTPHNALVNFRREFELPARFRRVVLHVSADSRYTAWMNADYVGQGPVRGWPNVSWRFDSYDITDRCVTGDNCLAFAVAHWGTGTFQYILGRAGLIAQVECDGETVVWTDGSWHFCPDPGHERSVARTSVQQAWVEVYDGRNRQHGWRQVGFHHGSWHTVREIGQAGLPPWGRLLPRDIPYLTNEPLGPTRLVSARVAIPPTMTQALELQGLPGCGQDLPDHPSLPILLATELENETHGPAAARLAMAHVPLRPGTVRLNGELVPVDTDGVAELEVPVGRSILVLNMDGPRNGNCGVYPIFLPGSSPSLRLISPLDRGARCPWIVLGPFGTDDAERLAWNDAFEIGNGVALTAHDRVMPVPEMVFAEQAPYGLTTRAEYVPDAIPALRGGDAFLASSPDVTRIEPHGDGDVELIIDFGKEVVGFIEFSLCATGGTVLDINGFEYMQPLDVGHIQWTEGLNNAMRYICDDGWQTYRSRLRRGFRYLSLTVRFPADADPLRLRHIRVYQNTYPYSRRGQFACSDESLTMIWEMSAYTTRLCSEDAFVDCPAYEQAFWVGDARNEALFAYMAFGDYQLARRCLILAGESLERSPMVESQVPSNWQNIIPAWSFLWVMACHEYVWHTDDLLFAGQIYPRLKAQAEHCRSLINDDGLFEIDAWNFLDWAGMDTPRQGVVTHNNLWLVMAWRRAADLARITGHADEANDWLDYADGLAAAINELLWDSDQGAFIDSIHADGSRSETFSQQTQVVACLADICDDARHEHITSYLAGVPEGWAVAGSPFMLSFVIEALARAGDFESMLQVIRGAWGLMLGNDATTCWETFPDWEKYGQPGQWLTRSHCHAWSAAPAYALPAFVMGIEPLARGFRRFSVEPRLQDLAWARAVVPSPHGDIVVEAQRDPDGRTLVDMTVPPTCIAELFGQEFPAGTHSVQLAGGSGHIR